MRIRLNFHKNDHMRYTGHLDLHRAWERAFRRAQLPLAYSQGFHPQPRLHLAAALPLGFTSQGEVADFWLEEDLPLEAISQALEGALPPGLTVATIEEVDQRAPSLQVQVCASEYEITLLDPVYHLERQVQAVLDQESLPRQRRGKPYDLRPLIEQLYCLPADAMDRARLFVRLSARPNATGRPEELLDVLDVPFQAARVHRTRLVFEDAL